jgi:hypothetical protein
VKRTALALALLLASASPAAADPISAAISAVTGAFKAAAATKLGSFLINTALSAGLSLASQALARRKAPRAPGIQTQVTTAGGTEPQGFMLGRYATAGHMAAPHMSHGADNRFLTYVTDLSDMPGCDLVGMIIDGAEWEIDDIDSWATIRAGTGTGRPVFLPGSGDSLASYYVGVRFHDGTQTTADAHLLDRYAAYPERPWTADHIGTGTCYAVTTFVLERSRFSSLPNVRFVLLGIPLYDPREDTSVGGDGPQRWADPATWERTDNPVVMIYNIMRGIETPTGETWGGGFAAEDLPLSDWVAAMNLCDVVVDGRPQFRAGLEVRFSEEPREVIGELLRACLGQIAEFGGRVRIRVGEPGVAVLSITDDDLLVEDQRFDVFPGVERTANYWTGSYPEPAALWQPKEAPAYTDAAWEAADGRRLPRGMSFPAVPYAGQVSQLLAAHAKDDRRFRVHRIVLPPMAAILEPLDAIEWTSARHGYDEKVFEVIEVIDRGATLVQEVVIRERDPADYDWDEDPPESSPVAGPVVPAVPAPAGFDAEPFTVTSGDALRGGIRLEWDEDTPFSRIEWQVRDTATAEVIRYGTQDTVPGFAPIFAGLVPSRAYQARARYVADRAATWSAWVDVTTPAVFVATPDLAENAATVVATAYTAGSVVITEEDVPPAAAAQTVAMTLPAGATVQVFATCEANVVSVSTKLPNVVAIQATHPTEPGIILDQYWNYHSGPETQRVVTIAQTFTTTAAGVWTITLVVGVVDVFDSGHPFDATFSQRFLNTQWLKR